MIAVIELMSMAKYFRSDLLGHRFSVSGLMKMKLHPEISSGWVLLYICLLLSIPGGDANSELHTLKAQPGNVVKDSDFARFPNSTTGISKKMDNNLTSKDLAEGVIYGRK